ncbi:hypothetical protein PO124_12520 [Bacillus licheniformis]|nr:hypothetical protein [Bacillus licheniformis]
MEIVLCQKAPVIKKQKPLQLLWSIYQYDLQIGKSISQAKLAKIRRQRFDRIESFKDIEAVLQDELDHHLELMPS